MKKAIDLKNSFLLIVISLLTFPLFAQPGGGPGRRQMTEEDIKTRVERLSETLELSDKQEEQLLKYELDEFNSRQDMMENFNGDREAMRTYMMEMREKRDKEYAKILSEEQMTTWIELREERMKNRQQQSGKPDSTKRNRGRGR